MEFSKDGKNFDIVVQNHIETRKALDVAIAYFGLKKGETLYLRQKDKVTPLRV